MPAPEQNLSLPVKYLIKRSAVFIDSGASVGEAARTMQRARIGSVLVAADPPGIITDRDLRSRVLAAGYGSETPARLVMTRPIKTLDSDALVFDALRLMLEENIHHLPLVEEGRIVGMVSSTDLLRLQTGSPFYLRHSLEDLGHPTEVGHYARELSTIVETLFRGGLNALQIGRIVSSLNDSLVTRLVKVAEGDLGSPPTDFAWIVFGSEGRFEQTLLTDQDNALVYGEQSEAASVYFKELSERVVNGLIEAGFPPCAGGFMATRWCKPLEEWQRLFHDWIRTPEPQALLDATIFFDFRGVAGDLGLVSLEEIVAGSRAEKLFITHMTSDALAFRPPLGFFGRIRSDHGRVDLKKGGIQSIVTLARVAALAAGSQERSTLERLSACGRFGALLTADDARELAETFQFLSHLRLRQQLTALEKNQPLDHEVKLNSLSRFDRRHLRDAFHTIQRIQDGVRGNLPALPV